MCVGNWYGFGWWFVPCIMMCILFAFLFVFAIPCLRSRTGSHPRWFWCGWLEKDGGEALAIAKRRYATGEISKEAFEEMKKTIA